MVLEELEAKTGDHKFIEGADRIHVYPVSEPDFEARQHEELRPFIDERWEDFVAERASRGLQTTNGTLVLTDSNQWEIKDRVLSVPVVNGGFKDWVTTRPAFRYADEKRPVEPVEDVKLHTVGVGALYIIDRRYLVLGNRYAREVGGEIDTPPAGFMKPEDVLTNKDPTVVAMEREAEEEVVLPSSILHRGAMKSNNWRNLTACFGLDTGFDAIRETFDIERDGSILTLKRKEPRASKYGEGGVYLHHLVELEDYVAEHASHFGERAALLLRRYFE
jgi:hypothetical protein